MNIPLFKIFHDEFDIEKINTEINSGANWAVGPKVEEFEAEIASYMGCEYVAVLNSGTSALHANILAEEISKSDEVIVPSFTFIATANASLFVGAKPVFADIEKDTFGLDPASVEENITKNTKAIIPIHYGGCPCKIKELKDLAEDNDLILIEDAAESFGANINGKMTGTFGDSGILSFCQNKVITTGEGGALITDSKELYEKIILLRSHGRLESSDYFNSAGYFDYVSIGYNWRMSNITAALGLSQIEKVDEIIQMRIENSKYMTKRLNEETNEIETFNPPKGHKHVYQLYSILANSRDKLINYLSENGISSKIYFDPVHLSNFYAEKLKYKSKLPVTEEISKKTLTLPMFPSIAKEEIDYIAEKVGEFYKDR